jgi:hypothetical protein
MSNDATYTKKELIHKFSEALGLEKATHLIDETVAQAQMTDRATFDKDDVIVLSKLLKEKGGFIAIMASCLASEAYRKTRE